MPVFLLGFPWPPQTTEHREFLSRFSGAALPGVFVSHGDRDVSKLVSRLNFVVAHLA